MKNKFQVGDRIAIYDRGQRYTARVGNQILDFRITVIEPSDVYLIGRAFHPKQCRRLVKRECKQVWFKSIDVDDNIKEMLRMCNEILSRPMPWPKSPTLMQLLSSWLKGEKK